MAREQARHIAEKNGVVNEVGMTSTYGCGDICVWRGGVMYLPIAVHTELGKTWDNHKSFPKNYIIVKGK